MKGLVFYEAATQVILILLLVLAVEARMFGTPSSRRNAVVFTVVLLVMVAGEVDALIVLQRSEHSLVDAVIVWTAIGCGLALATARAFPGPVRRRIPWKAV